MGVITALTAPLSSRPFVLAAAGEKVSQVIGYGRDNVESAISDELRWLGTQFEGCMANPINSTNVRIARSMHYRIDQNYPTCKENHPGLNLRTRRNIKCIFHTPFAWEGLPIFIKCTPRPA
ncbi:hypothetical protein CEXT_752281 [Caerostris extrusa]|uniref:Uncharacterized protein n=1 Tax=Caerostris extrusa TaxID=172846 RepID=A0AAV4QLB1_CAEEX|nr:hypothetical protein CEXT_752281 [Caerostris extrusa]